MNSLPDTITIELDLEIIKELMTEDRRAVDTLIQEKLHSEVDLINQLGHHIINSGGKRLRPIVVLLCARALGYKDNQHINLAAIVEFIHTATLLHDDVVDGSLLRRGIQTANAIWGNQSSVLVGDFLYSRAFEMMVDIGEMKVMDVLSHTTNTIAEGEVMQLLNCRNPDTTEEQYMQVIYRKTAKLFETAAQLGAIINGSGKAEERAMASFGKHLGNAYQMVDDVLDYSSSAEEMGKNVGDDLAEGKPTLPLIYAMRTGSKTEADIIRNAIEHGSRDDITPVTQAIESTNAIEYTAQVARNEADKALQALEILPTSEYRDALEGLVHFCIGRRF
jgi:octaprenyl-diphosphate synthase